MLTTISTAKMAATMVRVMASPRFSFCFCASAALQKRGGCLRCKNHDRVAGQPGMRSARCAARRPREGPLMGGSRRRAKGLIARDLVLRMTISLRMQAIRAVPWLPCPWRAGVGRVATSSHSLRFSVCASRALWARLPFHRRASAATFSRKGRRDAPCSKTPPWPPLPALRRGLTDAARAKTGRSR